MKVGKKLHRSRSDKVLTGLCGGLAEYLGVDSVIIRLIWLLIVVFSGFFPGVVVYIVASVLVPKNGHTKKK